MSVGFDSYCGLSCADCQEKTVHGCHGCIASNGNPFHGKCEIAECAKARGKRFCGECEQIPCEALTRYSQDEQYGDHGARIARCNEIKAQLVREAREGLNPIGYCGHHCDYCFLGQWCGGCRSGYHCCALSTMYDDGVCPNVACAQGRGLDGCYECEDLLACKKGYYQKEDEYVAKATALFIRRHGSQEYTNALKRAINDGVQYPKMFDASGSVANALAILEKYCQAPKNKG
ncbi:MAG: DUF3795 domain-containing protein [Clostridia bacterium]